MRDKKILIIGTVPYDRNTTSRAFESYFEGLNNDNLAQVFSDPKAPLKGQCSVLYQITDVMLLKRWFNKKVIVGKSYEYNQLFESRENLVLSKKVKLIDYLYRIGSHHTPATHLIRKILWRRKYWLTHEFKMWLNKFNPDAIFLSFSNDFFILNIANYIALNFDIPIITVLGDDYLFNKKFSLSPFYYLYRKVYIKNAIKLFYKNKHAIYISDKIKNKYENELKLTGETVYLASNFPRRKYKEIDSINPKICYFGNIGLDRYLSIIEIAKALFIIDHNYTVDVYTNRFTKKMKKEFDKCENIKFHESIPYSDVVKKTLESDIILLVEGFTKNNIRSTRYSLSTKVADSLYSGTNIFAYGSEECGMIDYLKQEDACFVCDNQTSLLNKLNEFINNEHLQMNYYNKSLEVYNKNHDINQSIRKTSLVINNAFDSKKS